MKSSDVALAPEDEFLSVDEQASSDPTAATFDDAFREQQQRIQRLNEYYSDVVAELRALFDQSDEGSWIRPTIVPTLPEK